MSKINILAIDARIKEQLRPDTDLLAILHRREEDISKLLASRRLSQRHEAMLASELERTQQDIRMADKSHMYHMYLAESAELIEQYKKALSTPVRVSFMGKKKPPVVHDSLLKAYLNVAMGYVSIEGIQVDVGLKCQNCDTDKHLQVSGDHIQVCTACGCQQDYIILSSSYRDGNRANISQKYTYDRKVHFKDCIKQYQGRQNSTVDQEVYDALEEQLRRHHLLQGDASTDRLERFANVTKKHIHLFLKELGYVKHYENVSLIHAQLTRQPSNDISHLETQLLNDFDALVELYDRKYASKPGFARKNFINTQYVLHQLLLRHKHPCNPDDFPPLKTVERKVFHDEITRACFADLGWNHTPLF